VAIVSDGLADRKVGCGAIVGRHVELNSDPFLVIGVLPASFTNVLAPSAEIWSPLREQATGDFNGRERDHHDQLLGRLAPSFAIDDARREVLDLRPERIGSRLDP
jgi:hypothetical protein